MKLKTLFLIGLLALGLTTAALAETGRINVITDVDGAEIYIDGQYVGKSSVNNYPLEAGQHYVQVKYQDKVRYAKMVTIYEGQVRSITSEHFVDIRTKTPNRGALDREAKRLRDTKGYAAFGIHGGSPASGISFKWWVWDRIGLQAIAYAQDDGTHKNNQFAGRVLIGFADKIFASQALSSYFALGYGSFDLANANQAYNGSRLDIAFGIEAALFGLFWDLELGLESASRSYTKGTGPTSLSEVNFRAGVHYYF